MKIESMDAQSRIPEFYTDRNQVQSQESMPIEQQQMKKAVPAKQALEIEMPLDADNRLVRMAIDKANKQMALRDTALQFEPYDKTGDMIVRIIDTNTKEVIREIPSKKILDMVANMLEMAGLLVDKKG